jgi:hypothetical protein
VLRRTWSLRLREEHRLRVFENRVLRIFGRKREGVIGGWRKLHNEDDQVKKDEMGGACGTNGYWWESQKERDHCGDQDVGGWTVLKWILER